MAGKTALDEYRESKKNLDNFNCESNAIDNVALAIVIAADKLSDAISALRFIGK